MMDLPIYLPIPIKHQELYHKLVASKLPRMNKPKLYNRTTRSFEYENTYKVNGLSFLYNSGIGKMFNSMFLNKRNVSKIYGRLMNGRGSVYQIPKFIKHYKINTSEIKRPINSFRSFNDFFTRELKDNARPIDPEPTHLISPCDSRLLVFDLAKQHELPVKGYWYSLADLVKDAKIGREYGNGWCFIYRLAPSDYHRFCYLDSGRQEKVRRIRGVLHSVHPIALSNTTSLMVQNYRELTMLHTKNFGKVVHLEVGALFVGKIVLINKNEHTFRRGEEKGWFEFGGSTIIQLFKKDQVQPDADIVEQSLLKIETIVRMGEKVGISASAGTA